MKPQQTNKGTTPKREGVPTIGEAIREGRSHVEGRNSESGIKSITPLIQHHVRLTPDETAGSATWCAR